MRRLVMSLAAPVALAAQTSGPALRVDVTADRRPISPYIYSINDYSSAQDGPNLARALRIPLARWGGDHTTRYNWKTDTYNSAADWFFENQPYMDSTYATLPDNSHFDKLVEGYTASGTTVLASISMMDWLPHRDHTCSFDINKYFPQRNQRQATSAGSDYDWQWRPNCYMGIKPDGTYVTGNDPNDTSYRVDEIETQDWVRHVVRRYGTAQQGGVRLWALDNEPVWWSGVHRDIHPEPQTYDETLQRGLRYGPLIKAVDPTAMIHGPVTAGWWDLWMSNKDLLAGWSYAPPWKWYLHPIDKLGHGDLPFIAWYLQQMANFERERGYRLLDVLDVHGYILPRGVGLGSAAGDDVTQALRLDSTRMLWDDTYAMPDPNDDFHFQPVRLIPRLREWVNLYYPGTRIAITEYNWGAMDHINGALAQADVLGIFGREDLFAGTIWGPPKVTDPAAFAFRIFLDYDGQGGRFGETNVRASSDDQGKLSIYAAERSDKALTVLVINKTTSDLTSTIALNGFLPAGSAEVWRYSTAALDRIARQDDLGVSGAGLSATFPAQSMTLFVIPADERAFTTPKPAIAAVVNAASYGTEIAPGQMAAIFGANLGAQQPIYYPALLNPDIVDSRLGGVRVLFDGVPAPLIAVTEGQVNCVVPYTAALRPTVHIQVEREGRRSDALEVPVAAIAPGLFTANASGKGQGAIINYYADGSSVPNNAQNPAPAGTVLAVYLTGEGVTDPPGVDGRIAKIETGRLERYPHPVAEVTAKIGGRAANVEYAGAAPYNMAGLCQVNVRVPDGLAAGNQPIEITIGGKTTQAGVTVAVR